jgi:hypothetical protein
MTTHSYQSWRREMGAISRGMMFIQGNIATPAALNGAESTGHSHPSAAVTSPISDTPRRSIPQALKTSARRLYRNLLFLGGRPMTAGRNDDIDEPFPQDEPEESAPSIPSPRFGERHRRVTPTQGCATC